MLRNAGSNGVGQQARSVAASTPASDGAEEATTATKKAENVSPLSVVVGAVALGVSLLKLVIWLVTPAHPTYQPVGGSPRAGDLSHSLPACELVFPGGQGRYRASIVSNTVATNPTSGIPIFGTRPIEDASGARLARSGFLTTRTEFKPDSSPETHGAASKRPARTRTKL